jgi:hypothetical protein
LGIDLRFKVWDGLSSRLGLLQGQRLGGLGPLSRRSSPAGGVGSDLGGLSLCRGISLSRRLVRTGLCFRSLLLSAAGLPFPLAGMVSGRLRFQFGFGLAQHLDAVLPPPQPFHLLVLRSWSKLPQLRILERDGVLHVLCRHQASILTADLVVRVRRNDGSEHWLSPAGLERSSKVVANSGLQISDSGSKEFEVYRLPLDAELVGLEARLENPGAIDAGTFDSIGPAAVWQR